MPSDATPSSWDVVLGFDAAWGFARAAGGYGGVPPCLRGWLTALVAVLGFALGGLLSAVINVGATRIIGTPEPSEFVFDTTPGFSTAGEASTGWWA
jgi:hypothetical protein